MSAPGRVSADEQYKSVAFVITHTIKTGEEKRYEDWTKEILNASSSYPGYLGREVFRPAAGSRKYTTIVRFDRDEHLRAWIDSDTRRELHRPRRAICWRKATRTRSGPAWTFWFTPEGTRSPKAWKQFLLTTSAVYPLSLIIPRLLAPLFRVAPPLGHPLVANLLVAIILTGLLTFVIMPRYTRLFRRWLYKGTE
jgi:antibiotic biosynthesis monooxygenase (ABM) superfamily enzyme